MKKLILLTLAVAFIAGTSFGQKDETLFNKLKFTGAWGGNSFQFAQFGENYSTLSGGYGGLEFSKDFFIGGGGLTSVGDFDLGGDSYSLDYGGLLVGYSPKSYKTLHLQTMVLLGGGELRNVELNERDDFLVIQPYVGVELNIVRWMRLGIGGGYRAVFDNSDPSINTSGLSNAYGEVRLKFGWSWGR